MKTNPSLLLVGAVALAGGVVALLLAPRTGPALRQSFIRQARAQQRRLGDQWRQTEAQVARLEAHLHESTVQFGERLREITGYTLDQYVPDFPDEAWALDRDEMERDLRRMPGA